MIWAIIELYLNIRNSTIYAHRSYRNYTLQLFGKDNA